MTFRNSFFAMHLSYSRSSFNSAAREQQNNSSADFSSFFLLVFVIFWQYFHATMLLTQAIFPQDSSPLLHLVTVFFFCCFLPHFFQLFHFLVDRQIFLLMWNIQFECYHHMQFFLSFLALLPHLLQMEH